MFVHPKITARMHGRICGLTLLCLTLGMLQPPVGLAVDRAPRARQGNFRASNYGSQRSNSYRAGHGTAELGNPSPAAFIDATMAGELSATKSSPPPLVGVTTLTPALRPAPPHASWRVFLPASPALQARPHPLAAGRAPPQHR